MRTPSPPDAHYLQLGRVTAAFAMLDIQMGMIGRAAKTGEPWTENWKKVAGRPGQAVTACTEAAELLPQELADRVRNLLQNAKNLRDERHRLSHGVFILDPDTELASHPWLLRTTRNEEVPLLDEQRGDELVRTLNVLSKTAGELRVAVAGWVRTGGQL
jgi:hypothetical protein